MTYFYCFVLMQLEFEDQIPGLSLQLLDNKSKISFSLKYVAYKPEAYPIQGENDSDLMDQPQHTKHVVEHVFTFSNQINSDHYPIFGMLNKLSRETINWKELDIDEVDSISIYEYLDDSEGVHNSELGGSKLSSGQLSFLKQEYGTFVPFNEKFSEGLNEDFWTYCQEFIANNSYSSYLLACIFTGVHPTNIIPETQFV